MASRTVHLHFDLDNLKISSHRNVKRCAAMLAIAMNSTSDWRQQSLSLTSESMYNFLNDPNSDELRELVTKEFRIWVAGNILRELDAGFSLFLDRAWSMLAWSKHHGSAIKSDYTIKTIESDTNSAKKYERIMRAADADPIDGESLRSLSTLRNCLAHAQGIVTDRHRNTPTALVANWRAWEMRLYQDGDYSVLTSAIIEPDKQIPDQTKPAQLVGVVVDRRREFCLGEPIVLTPLDLHEICWGYLTRTDEVIGAIQRDMLSRGISTDIASPVPMVYRREHPRRLRLEA